MNFGFLGDRDCKADAINGKLSELHAAVGLAELDAWTEKKLAWQTVAERYRHLAAGLGMDDRIFTAPTVASCYVLFLAADEREAVAIRQALTASGIGHRLWYGLGLHKHTHFQGSLCEALPVTDSLAPRLIGLPAAVDLDQAAILEVLQAIDAVRAQHLE